MRMSLRIPPAKPSNKPDTITFSHTESIRVETTWLLGLLYYLQIKTQHIFFKQSSSMGTNSPLTEAAVLLVQSLSANSCGPIEG